MKKKIISLILVVVIIVLCVLAISVLNKNDDTNKKYGKCCRAHSTCGLCVKKENNYESRK